jgi:cell division protein FtsB
VVVARKREKRTRSGSARRLPPRRRLRLFWLLGLVAVAVYLYYRPIASYVETKRDLAAREAEVETLRAVKASLEARLESSTSLEATAREARRLGYVRRGEQLFVVKGIPEWRRKHRSLRGDE